MYRRWLWCLGRQGRKIELLSLNRDGTFYITIPTVVVEHQVPSREIASEHSCGGHAPASDFGRVQILHVTEMSSHERQYDGLREIDSPSQRRNSTRTYLLPRCFGCDRRVAMPVWWPLPGPRNYTRQFWSSSVGVRIVVVVRRRRSKAVL